MRIAYATIGLLLLASLAACERSSASRAGPKASAASSAGHDVFDGGFGFRCSTIKDVGCGGVLPMRSDSEVAILKDGQDAFRARVASLRAAKRSIRVQALIFRADEAGLFIANLLKDKKKEGVDVRLIVDAASNLDWKTQWMYFDLKQHGIEVEGYEALYLHWVSAELAPGDPLRANKRFHDKIWLVDAEDAKAARAIVGGLNIANEYFRVDATPINRWTDQDVMLRGPIVQDVLTVFDRNYAFFKDIKSQRPGVLNTDNSWKLSRPVLRKIAKVKEPDWLNETISTAIDKTLERPAELSFAPASARFVQSRPRMKETYIRQAYDDLIDRAERSILIANAYFIPSRELIDRLKAAARRGVRVVVLTNSPATNDIEMVALVSRYIYRDLLEVNNEPALVGRSPGDAGIEIYEWAGAPFDEGTLHAKYAVVDGKEAIVGSYNLDPRSDRLNSETALAIRSEPLAQALHRTFIDELLPKSESISWGEACELRKPKGVEAKFKLLFSLPIKKWL